MERESTRAGRAGVSFAPHLLDHYTTADALWAETDEERRQRLVRAECRDALLDWVRAHLAGLREAQRAAIELHYFAGLTYEQAGYVLQRDPSVVKRAEKRAIRALRAMKAEDPTWDYTVRCTASALAG